MDFDEKKTVLFAFNFDLDFDLILFLVDFIYI